MDTKNRDTRRNTMDSTNSSSTTSSSKTSTKIKSALVRLSGIFSRSTTVSTLSSSSPSNRFTSTNRRSLNSSSSSSVSTPPSSVMSVDITLSTASTSPPTIQGRKKKRIDRGSGISDITIPPFSPTYCKPNEFPYSNFYMKLPNGKWMIRYRSGTRSIIGTDEFAGSMI